MLRLFPLVRAYLRFHWGKTVILAICLATALYVPLAAHGLVRLLQQEMTQRAEATPLVIGAQGSRFDLVLHALYFRTEAPGQVRQAERFALEETGRGAVYPLHVRHRARGFPVVGTTLEYFAFRGLGVEAGTAPLRLGDAVIGWEVARSLELRPGDRLPTDPTTVFELGGAYPLDLRITGILERARSPDDRAVFVDLRTAWVIDGIGHGHDDLEAADAAEGLIARDDRHRVAGAALTMATRITSENIAAFHFHGDPADFPLTAVVVAPTDARERALLLGRYLDGDGAYQALRPPEVIGELLGLVVRLKRFFDLHHLFLLGVTVLFIGLVMLLSLRLRAGEIRTMVLLGCARGTIFRLTAAELVLLLAVSAVVAVSAATLTAFVAKTWIQTLVG
ncbi:MAG: hypothetical protein EA425_10230 [Puniceicoccaceae bacterium]|nr:MAG: hypothetical protein EA425_10230 [Puniceicoccaceae bacterium]